MIKKPSSPNNASLRTKMIYLELEQGFGRLIAPTALPNLPSFVLFPVAVTSAMHFPLLMVVPWYNILWPSDSCLSAGNDSPVITDSFTERSFSCKIMASAGIFIPSSNNMISPGTSSSVAIIISSPSPDYGYFGSANCCNAFNRIAAFYFLVQRNGRNQGHCHQHHDTFTCFTKNKIQ